MIIGQRGDAGSFGGLIGLQGMSGNLWHLVRQLRPISCRTDLPSRRRSARPSPSLLKEPACLLASRFWWVAVSCPVLPCSLCAHQCWRALDYRIRFLSYCSVVRGRQISTFSEFLVLCALMKQNSVSNPLSLSRRRRLSGFNSVSIACAGLTSENQLSSRHLKTHAQAEAPIRRAHR